VRGEEKPQRESPTERTGTVKKKNKREKKTLKPVKEFEPQTAAISPGKKQKEGEGRGGPLKRKARIDLETERRTAGRFKNKKKGIADPAVGRSPRNQNN